MKILGRTQSVRDVPLGECFARFAECGFDGVEVCLEHPELAPATMNEGRARELAGQLDDLGLRSRSLSYHADYIHSEDRFREVLDMISLTPALGTSVFVFGGGGERGDEGEWETMVARTGEIARAAESAGVLAAKEFEPGFVVSSTSELLRVFEAVDNDALSANLDLGHSFLCDPDPFEAIELLRDRIPHCHIENMAAGVHRHLLPHEGDMDLTKYIAKLSAVGFEGPLALDLYGVDYLGVSANAVRYLRDRIREAARESRNQ
jgi:sugar phosphate isomerase/epimerase